MQRLAHFRAASSPFVLLGAYVAIGIISSGLMYVPGGLEPQGSVIGGHSLFFALLVYFLARGSRIAWRIAVVLECLGLLSILVFAGAGREWQVTLDLALLAGGVALSLWLLTSPSLRAHIRPPYTGLHPPLSLQRRMRAPKRG